MNTIKFKDLLSELVPESCCADDLGSQLIKYDEYEIKTYSHEGSAYFGSPFEIEVDHTNKFITFIGD